MKKLTLLPFVLFLLTGCEKEFNNVVDSQTQTYTFAAPSVPQNVDYTVSPVITPSVKINNLPAGSTVWFDVVSLTNDALIADNNLMKDDGQTQTDGDTAANDNIYTGKFTFTNQLATGNYELSFWVKAPGTGGDVITKRIALKTVAFNGYKPNEAPVISDLALPDSVNALVDFTITLKVTDANGLSDINSVFFVLTDPNGRTAGTFYLTDDGPYGPVDPMTGQTSGDIAAGDGIYSKRLHFNNTTAVKGDWTFSFQAKDNSNALSNTITQKLTLK